METTKEERQLNKIKKLIKRNKALIYILKEDRNLTQSQLEYNYRIATLKRELISSSSRYRLEYKKFKQTINEIFETVKDSKAELTAEDTKKILEICEEYRGIQPCKQTKMNYRKSYQQK